MDQKDNKNNTETKPRKIIAVPVGSRRDDSKWFGRETRYRYYTQDGDPCDESGVEFTNVDLKRNEELLALDLREDKAETQRKMAKIAMVSMFVVLIVLLSPLIPDTRIDTVSEVLVWFFIAQASIVGAFMGFTSWMGKR